MSRDPSPEDYSFSKKKSPRELNPPAPPRGEQVLPERTNFLKTTLKSPENRSPLVNAILVVLAVSIVANLGLIYRLVVARDQIQELQQENLRLSQRARVPGR